MKFRTFEGLITLWVICVVLFLVGGVAGIIALAGRALDCGIPTVTNTCTVEAGKTTCRYGLECHK